VQGMVEILITLIIILGVLALIGTFFAGILVNKTVKSYEHDQGDRVNNQIKRSLEYETSSLKKNVPILSIVYGITFLIAIIVIIFIIGTNV
jgi:hypothetical protein